MKALDVIAAQGAWLIRHSHQRQASRADTALSAAAGLAGGTAPAEAAPAAPSAVSAEPGADGGGGKSEQQLVAELWLAVLRALGRASTAPNRHLRNHAIQALHGCASRAPHHPLTAAAVST